MLLRAYLLPLVDVADEPGQPQQPQQAEDLGEADDAQRPGRLVHLGVQPPLHDEEDVIHGDGGHKVHHEPALQVLLLDLLGVQDDLRVVLEHDARPEVQHQVHEEEGVGHHVEDDPRRGGLLLEEGDAHGDDDQVAHHEHQHGEVPVEPEARRGGDTVTQLGTQCAVYLLLWRCNPSHLTRDKVKPRASGGTGIRQEIQAGCSSSG